MNQVRNLGIDLLRIVLTFFICVLHVLGMGGVLSSSSGTIGYYVFWFIEILCYCAVDGYALISGYVSQSNRHNYKRIILILAESIFYSFVFTYILRQFYIGEPLNHQYFFEASFPFVYDKFWYITAYFPLFFIMPLINSGVNSINDKQAKQLLVIMFLLFSVLCIYHDNYSLNNGYSFIWLAVLYTMGSLMKKVNFFNKLSNTKLLIIYLLCVVFTWGLLCFCNNNRYVNYVSPTILLSAMVLIVLFSRLQIKSSFVSKISSLCLGIYLYQNSEVVWNHVINNLFIFIPKMNIVLGVLAVLGCALLMFIIGALLDTIRTILFNIFRVDKIAGIGHKVIDKLIDKISSVI